MSTTKYEYQSEFARRYYGKGKAEGEAEGISKGRIELILRMLSVRYKEVSPSTEVYVRGVSSSELDCIAERLLSAGTLQEALGGSTCGADGSFHLTPRSKQM
jgi:hypothetical protein